MARFDPFCSDFEHPFVNSSPDYGLGRASVRPRPIGDSSPSPVNSTSSFRERRNHLRDLEDKKNQLIDDLLFQLENTQRELTQLELLRKQEVNTRRHMVGLEEQLKQIETIVDRDPYIIFLVDGNHASFTKALLKQGESGGRRALEQLLETLGEFASQRMPELKTPKFKVRIYADFKSLVTELIKLDVIETATDFEKFVRGFNDSSQLFDLIDAGVNQRNTEQKLLDQLHLNLYNCHCRHVILGGFESDNYSESLQKVQEISEVSNRLTLLENISEKEATPEWQQAFSTISINKIFCSSKTITSSPKPVASMLSIAAPVLARIESSSTGSHLTPSTSAASTPPLTWAGLAAQPVVAAATPAISKTSTVKPVTKDPPIVSKKPSNHGVIDYNRSGQRIDKQDTTIPYHEITRIKKMKLCNVYYLQGSGSCTTTGCSHRHDYPITNFERRVLREVARMTPCYYKMDCDDAECIYGHRCPQSKPGDDGCYYGEDCRFWGWGHGIDTKVVKTTKV